MKSTKILVVGSMNMDLNVYGIPRIPKFGESIPGTSYAYTPGGKGANQAYAAALQGAHVTMVGKIGEDENGHMLKSELEKVGVNTDFVVTDPTTQTGLAQIMVDNTGKYFSCIVPGANDQLTPEEVEAAINSDHFDMVLMQLEIPIETVYRTYELANQRNIPVFLDAGPAMNIPLDRLKGIHIISPNEVETEALTGIIVNSQEKALEAAKQLFERVNPTYVVLKMGEHGAFAYDGTKSKMYPAFNVQAKDSTAAGDTFNSSLAVKLCENVDFDQAIQFATAASAICVSRNGAQSSIPNLYEVDDFLRNYHE